MRSPDPSSSRAGRYQVRLKAEGKTYAASFETRLDPRAAVPQADLEAQFELLLRIRDRLSETHDAINRIRTIRGQVESWEKRAADDRTARSVVRAAAKLRRELSSIEEELIQTKAVSRQDTLNFPIKLNAKLGGLAAAIAMGDAAPTRSMNEVFADLSRRIDVQLARLERTLTGDVRAFEALARRSRLPVIGLPKKASAGSKVPVRRRRASAP